VHNHVDLGWVDPENGLWVSSVLTILPHILCNVGRYTLVAQWEGIRFLQDAMSHRNIQQIIPYVDTNAQSLVSNGGD